MAHRCWGEIITYNVRLRRVPMYPIIDDGLLMPGHILCPRWDSVQPLTCSGVNNHLGRETNEGCNGKGTERGSERGHKQRALGNAGKRKCVYSCQRAGIKGQSHAERSHRTSKEDIWVQHDRWRWKRFYTGKIWLLNLSHRVCGKTICGNKQLLSGLWVFLEGKLHGYQFDSQFDLWQ